MSAPLYIPSSSVSFNGNPVSSSRGTTASYTVPAGKYALVTIVIAHSLFPTSSITANQGRIPTVSAQGIFGTAGNTSFNVWMKAGEIINLATTNTNGTATVTGSVNGVVSSSVNATATMSTAITVNSVLWRNIVSKGTYSSVVSIATLAQFETCSITLTMTCESSSGWWAQEYTA